tara:strand:- start:14078 stop:15160 length:1083 start_codon:yes stop_codon:yes gene_type:complete
MNEYIFPFIEIIIGVLLLFIGGEFFIQGAVALSLILGIPQIVIGLTVVALGTSSPELMVSINSVLKGSDSIAASNVIGSNIFNILVVLGISSIITPLKVKSRIVRRDVPILIAISCAVWAMSSTGVLTWQSGVFLLLCLILNTIWEINTINEKEEDTRTAEPEINDYLPNKNLVNIFFKLIIGISLLSYGSNILVNGSRTLAILMGIKETIIGLTIVATGTSLPELVTSIVASLKGKTDLAIGNVIGSNLLNQLLILGSCTVFSGLNGLNISNDLIRIDLPIMVLATLACLPIFRSKGKITRIEGILLVNIYTFYLLDKIFILNNFIYLQEFRLSIFVYSIILISTFLAKKRIASLKIRD